MVLRRAKADALPGLGTKLYAFYGALLSALAMGGCGDLSSATSQPPLFIFTADLLDSASWPMKSNRLLGIVWSDPLQRRPDVVMPQSWIEVQWDPATLGRPGAGVAIFRPPPPEALSEIRIEKEGEETVEALLAVGDVVVVNDDGDGRFAVEGPLARLAPEPGALQSGDAYIAAASALLIYVEQPFKVAPPDSPLSRANIHGYQLLDYVCNGRVPQGQAQGVRQTHFSLALSADLPESRDCVRTHRP